MTGIGRLAAEKLPFLLLAAVCSAITMRVQRETGAVAPLSGFTIPERAANALVAYVRYLGKTIWPADLAVLYPFPSYPHPHWPAWQILGSAALLAAITLAVVWQRRRRPFLLFGWLWFLLTLLPVIGLVQVGHQSIADRYTYIPHIGLFVMLAWTADEWVRSRHAAKGPVCAVAVLAVAACGIAAAAQLRYWRNSETLCRHTLEVTTNNAMIQLLLGEELLRQDRLDEARPHLQEAVRLGPSLLRARLGFAEVLVRQQRIPELIGLYRDTLRRNPNQTDTLNDLAWILATAADASLRNGAEAVGLAERACSLTDYRVTRFVGTLAAAYSEAGRFSDAISTAQKAIASAVASGDADLARRNQELLDLYQSGKAWHETAQP